MRYIVFMFLILALFISCGKDESQSEVDDKLIQEYLSNHGITAIKHDSGLYYLIGETGSGPNPASNSQVTVKYMGYLTNGDIFDQTSGNSTATFNLNQLIEGWKIGIPMLKSGGKGTFFIPSQLGYGSKSTGSIPANSVLIFEIELVDFY